MEQQAIETAQKMKEAIEQKDQEILALTAQVQAYERSRKDFEQGIMATSSSSARSTSSAWRRTPRRRCWNKGADAVKSAAEADKAQMDVEQKAIQLETQKIKSATEIMRSVGV